MLPTVSITKSDGNTGVVRPSEEGVLAIIAPCEKGTANQPASYSRQDLTLTDLGYGPLTDFASYVMSVAKRPVVLIRGTASTAATLSAVTHTGPGTSVVTVSGTPLDDFEAEIVITLGGTIATGPISLKYSLDGGKSYSGIISLGTATSYTIPNSGVTFAFAAGSVLTGQREQTTATGARMTNANLVTALEALRTYGGAWDAILVGGLDAAAADVATLDAWLSTREGEGKFKTAVVNSLPRAPGSQTEAQYATAMTTAWSAASSTRVVVCADAGYLQSLIRGVRTKRPVALGLAARGMLNDISRDCAFVADGPIAGFQIADDRGNPLFHDELLYPGLDDLRLTTLRSFYGRQGAYINNPLLISPSGSDYVFWQHARVMNKACDVTFQLLTARLSQGVRKDAATGFIKEEDAQELEALVNAELEKQLVTPGRVSAATFVLSRNDDLTSNAGATLTGEIQISALAYIKKFNLVSRFVKTISVNAS